MPKGYETAEMRGSEYSPWQQSSHSSLRTGKPSTWQRGTVNHFQNRKDGVWDTMRNPIHVLKSLEEKASVSNNKYERLYRNLYYPEFYLLAFANIAKSQGSMTQGVDGQTLDNMSLPRINRIIESIRNRTYQPKPAKRKYIPKKNVLNHPCVFDLSHDAKYRNQYFCQTEWWNVYMSLSNLWILR